LQGDKILHAGRHGGLKEDHFGHAACGGGCSGLGPREAGCLGGRIFDAFALLVCWGVAIIEKIEGDWRSWLARQHDTLEVTGSSPVSPMLVSHAER
jgi:hypothetical protein